MAALFAIFAAFAIAAPAFANGTSVIFPDPVSPNGHRIYTLYELISIPAIVIFVGVEAALLYIILKFRRRYPEQVGKQYHGNTTIEVVWTVIPTILVAAIALGSYFELVKDFTPEAAASGADFTVAVRGYQFNWKYTYDQGFTVADTMVVPVGKQIHMTFTSDNVIHSWWVPAISGKTDAVPGYENQSWMKIDADALQNCPVQGNDRSQDKATGGCKYHGECAELCGAGHSQMQIDVLAVSQAEFDKWVAEQKAPKPSPSPSAAGSAPAAAPSPSPSP